MKIVEIGHCTLIHADCMDVMRELPDKAFDLAICDPPYGIGENGSRSSSRRKLAVAKDYKPFAGLDSEPPSNEYFSELKRVSLNQIIWGANHFITRFAADSSCWIVWDKITGNSDFADSELAWTSFKTAVRNFRFQWSGMLQGNMKDKEIRIHPTQKPVALYSWLLTNYAKTGQTILDTHLGSGSSAIAANKLGFSFTGIELDEDYFNAACERIAQHHKQTSLFDSL
jgi:site-specific DNA-methyltransferase (adenine-specific)